MTFILPKLPDGWKWMPIQPTGIQYPEYIISAGWKNGVTLSRTLRVSASDTEDQILSLFSYTSDRLCDEVWLYKPFEEPNVMQEIFEAFNSGGE